MRWRLLLFCTTKTTHFWTGLWSYMIIYGDRLSGWTTTKLYKPNLYQKNLWWLFSGLLKVLLIPDSLIREETITAEKYCQQIFNMCMSPALVIRKCLIILQDNARLHVSIMTRQKLHDLSYKTLNHPPNSSDIWPTNYHFFKHLDNVLKKKCLIPKMS